jgi:membrane associated rhomboid family serine protease
MEQYRPSGFQVLPPVVKNLLIINGIFFLATIVLERTFHIDLVDILGLHYFSSQKFHPYQIISYMFMHGGFGHIFFNMFALWMFGSAIENYWGPKRFLSYYLITGIGAAILHYVIFFFKIRPEMEVLNNYIFSPDDGTLQALIARFPDLQDVAGRITVDYIQELKVQILNQPVIVGASGALFGLLLAFGMMFPNSRIYVYFAIPVKAKYFVIFYGLIELVSGVSASSGDNVAHFAHLGGMLFGFILLKIWNVRRMN